MSHIFEITDKTGRKIHLTKERWAHTRIEHANIENYEEIIQTIQKPDKSFHDEREDVEYYFKYLKHKKGSSKFLRVIVKYIKEEGSILSAHFVRSLK